MTLIQVVNSYLVWGGVALHCADKISEAHYENTIKEFLLSVVKYVPDCYNTYTLMSNMILIYLCFVL